MTYSINVWNFFFTVIKAFYNIIRVLYHRLNSLIDYKYFNKTIVTVTRKLGKYDTYSDISNNFIRKKIS